MEKKRRNGNARGRVGVEVHGWVVWWVVGESI